MALAPLGCHPVREEQAPEDRAWTAPSQGSSQKREKLCSMAFRGGRGEPSGRRFGVERQSPEVGTPTNAQALGQGLADQAQLQAQPGSWGGQRGYRRKDRVLPFLSLSPIGVLSVN